MKKTSPKNNLLIIILLSIVLLFSNKNITFSQNADAIIIDHTCTDITAIPQSAIEKA